MIEDGKIVLDHFDNIVVSTEANHNLLSGLQGLEMGMFYLAEFTRRREVEALEKDRRVFFIDFGSGLELLLGCMFDWFSVSLVNYMRTIQLIQLIDTKGWDLDDLKRNPVQRELDKACNLYIKQVAPDVLQWRNKIAAHRAATSPRSDNLSTLTYSTFPTVSYDRPYYGVGNFKLSLGDGSVSDFQPWNLSEKYEELAPRYWPGQELTKLDW